LITGLGTKQVWGGESRSLGTTPVPVSRTWDIVDNNMSPPRCHNLIIFVVSPRLYWWQTAEDGRWDGGVW